MEQLKNHPLYRKHDIDSAMSALWAFYKSNFLVLFGISAVMSVTIQFAASMIDMTSFQEAALARDFELMVGNMKELLFPAMIVSLIGLFFAVVLQHFIIHRPVDEGNSIMVSAIQGIKYFFPFLILMILMSFLGAFALMVGLLMLVVGAFFVALYMFTLYVILLPVLIIEGTNIGNAISRTFSLLHRNFWTNVGWAAVFLILLIVISFVLSAIMLPLTAGAAVATGDAPVITGLTTNPLIIILSGLLNALTLPLMPIFGCILYFTARAREDESINVPPEEYKPRIEDLYSRPRDETRNDPDL